MDAARGAAAQGAGSLLGRVFETWAMLGGLLLLGVVLMTAWSATSGVLFSRPLPGDVELTEMLVAVAVFMFLPYCQASGANVTADIFTARASRRTLAVFSLLSAAIALAFSGVLTVQMSRGLLDYLEFIETTTILRIPIWYAYVPVLASLAMLVLAALVSSHRAIRDLKRER